MADRRTDEASVAPSRSSEKGAAGSSTPSGKTASSASPGSKEGTGQSARSRGSERFAAAVAKAREGQRPGKGKDTAGDAKDWVKKFNAQGTGVTVELVEFSPDAGQQRNAFVQRQGASHRGAA